MLLKKNQIDMNFYKRLFIITLPIVIQNLINSLLNMVDTFMIGQLGEFELASVGIANQFFFFYCLILFGINAGGAMFISQYWGKKDINSIRKTMSISLFYTIICSIIFMILALRKSSAIISVFNPNTEIVSLGSSYLKIVALSYIFTGITISYAFASRSIENTVLPMVSNIIGLIINIILNYLLIFGNLGFPELGVKGAAIATVIARMTECLFILFFVYYKKIILNIKFKDFKFLNKSFNKHFFIGTLPILFNECVWGLGNITYNIIYARIGVTATATMQISTTIMNLFMIVIMGLGNSAVIIIGKEVGANNIENAKKYSKKLYKTSLIIGVFIAIIIYLNSFNLANIFNMSNEVLISTQRTLMVNAVILLLRTYNFIMIVGILRGGGDSKFALITQGFTMWFIGIPIAYFGAFVMNWPIYAVVGLCAIEEIIKMYIINKRFKSFKWIHNIT